MYWVVLVISGVLEAVWATALAESNGFRRLRPTVVFLVSAAVSMAGLAYAMTAIPTPTAYAVWVGVGASLTVVVSMVRGQERASIARIALIVLLVSCVVGLRAVS